MPFKSRKQRAWMKLHKPELYEQWKQAYGLKVGGGRLKSETRPKGSRRGRKGLA